MLTRTAFPGTPDAAGLLHPFHRRSHDAPGLHLTETHHPAGYRIPLHGHRMLSVFLVLAGGLGEKVGRQELELSAGDLVFTPADEPHSDVFRGAGGRCLVIEMQPSLIERVVEHARLPREIRLRGPAAWLAQRLSAEMRHADELSPLVIEGLSYQLLGAVCRPTRRRAPAPSQVMRARSLLEDCCAERLSLGGVAREVGLHPLQLARLFRRRYGCSVGEYLRRRRIEEACARLSSSREPLAEIATALGFYDQAHFTRTFRRLTGTTPAAYRRRH